MTGAALSGRLRPTVQQEDLLRCAFGGADAAGEVWARVRATLDWDRMDGGCHALMPAVGAALTAAGVDDPLLPRMTGISRKAWYANQLLLDAGRRAVASMAYDGVEVLALDGTAMLLGYVPDLSRRRTANLDFAVRAADEGAARGELGRTGWLLHPDAEHAGPGDPVPYADADGRILRLHVRPPALLERPGGEAGDYGDVWAATRPAALGEGAELRVPDPALQLLLAVVLTPESTIGPQPLWLADVATLLEGHGGAVDWTRVVQLAAERRLVRRLHAALAYLDERIGVAVPAAGLARLREAPPAPREGLEEWLHTRPSGPLRGLPRALSRHVRRTADLAPARAAAGLPASLREAWVARSR